MGWQPNGAGGFVCAKPLRVVRHRRQCGEWVEDCWHKDYKGAPGDGTAWNEDCGTFVFSLVRGGSWNYASKAVKSAYRHLSTIFNYRVFNIGFRLAQDL